MDVQSLNSFAGLFSLVLTIGVAIVLAVSVGKNKAGKVANEAQQSAIEAMQAELATHRGQIDDLHKKNRRLSRTVQATVALLKKALSIELQIDESAITLRSKDGTVVQYLNLEEEKELL